MCDSPEILPHKFPPYSTHNQQRSKIKGRKTLTFHNVTASFWSTVLARVICFLVI